MLKIHSIIILYNNTLMNMNKMYKTTITLTAFLILGAGLSMAFKDKGVISSVAIDYQYASANTIKEGEKTANETDPRKYLKNADLGKISQATQLPIGQVASIVSKITSSQNLGECLESSGGVTAKGLNDCKPPGPGRFTGNPFSPGMDFAPCTVTGVQGGSVQAMCLAGCCRAVSVTGVGKALNLSNLSPEQLLQLGMKGAQLLQGLFGGGYGGYSAGQDGITVDTGNDTYYGYDYSYNGTDTGGYSFDTYSYNSIDTSNTNTEIKTVTPNFVHTNKPSKPVSELLNNLNLLTHKNEPSVKPTFDTGNMKDTFTNNTQTNSGNNRDRTLEFQILEKQGINDPRLNALRNPDDSLVRKSLFNKKTDYTIDVKPQKSLWDMIVDFITSPFK